MTKEKALEIFKFMLKSGKGTIDYWDGTIAEQRAAIEMAIKALEIVEEFEKAQIITGGRLNGRTYAYKCGLEVGKRKALEQQPSEDCVSRQAVINLINEDWKYEGLELSVNELPPVTPTRKSGLHWIERFDNESMWLECPHCHMDSIAAYNYCPNCGASFKEEKRGNSDGSN